MEPISAVPVDPEEGKKQGKDLENEELFQVIVFRLGEEEYGLMIDQIKEVVATPQIARVPMSPDHIRGVANIRGNILAIVDLEKKFNLPIPDELRNQVAEYTLVVESWEHNMGILVRQVPNTLSVKRTQIDRSPQAVQDGGERNYIEGIIKAGNRLIILIDIFKVISAKELAH